MAKPVYLHRCNELLNYFEKKFLLRDGASMQLFSRVVTLFMSSTERCSNVACVRRLVKTCKVDNFSLGVILFHN